MGIFKKSKKNKNVKVPRNTVLYGTLRGIDEIAIAKARKMQGYEQIIRHEKGIKKIELVKLKDATK